MFRRPIFEVFTAAILLAAPLVSGSTEAPGILNALPAVSSIAKQPNNSSSSTAKFLFLNDPNVVELKSFEDWLAALHGVYLGPGPLFNQFFDEFYAAQSNVSDRIPPDELPFYLSDLLRTRGEAQTKLVVPGSSSSGGTTPFSGDNADFGSTPGNTAGESKNNPRPASFSVNSALTRTRQQMPFHNDTISKIRHVFRGSSYNPQGVTTTTTTKTSTVAPGQSLVPTSLDEAAVTVVDDANEPEVAVVMYYAIWCPHCHRRAPSFSALAARLRCAKRIKFFAFECSQKTPDRVGAAGVLPSAVCRYSNAKMYPRFALYWRYQRFPGASSDTFFVPSPFELDPPLLGFSDDGTSSRTNTGMPVTSDLHLGPNPDIEWVQSTTAPLGVTAASPLPLTNSVDSRMVELVLESVQFSAQRKPSALKFDLMNAWPLPVELLTACPGQPSIVEDTDLAWMVPNVFEMPLSAVIAKASSPAAWVLPAAYNRSQPVMDGAAFELVPERWPAIRGTASDACPDGHLHDALQGLFFLLRNWVPMSSPSAEAPILLEPLHHLLEASSSHLPGSNIRKALSDFRTRLETAAGARLDTPRHVHGGPAVIGKDAYQSALDSLELGGLKPLAMGDIPEFVVANQLSSSLWLLFETLAAGTVTRSRSGVRSENLHSNTGTYFPGSAGSSPVNYTRCTINESISQDSRTSDLLRSGSNETNPLASESFLSQSLAISKLTSNIDESMVSPQSVANAIRVTVATYFGCDYCREHFMSGFDRCLGGRCEWIPSGGADSSADASATFPVNSVAVQSSQGVVTSPAVGLLMWIWRFHNIVTLRTAVERDSDAVIAFLERQATLVLEHIQQEKSSAAPTPLATTRSPPPGEPETFFPQVFYPIPSEVRYPSRLECPRCYLSDAEENSSGVLSENFLERGVDWQRKVRGFIGTRLKYFSNVTEIPHEEFDHYQDFRLQEVFDYLMQVYWRASWEQNRVLIWNTTKSQFDVLPEQSNAEGMPLATEEDHKPVPLRFQAAVGQPGGTDRSREVVVLESRILKGEKVVVDPIGTPGFLMTVKSGHSNVFLLLAAVVVSAFLNFCFVRRSAMNGPGADSTFRGLPSERRPPSGWSTSWFRHLAWKRRPAGTQFKWRTTAWVRPSVKSLDHVSPPRVDEDQLPSPASFPVRAAVVRGRKAAASQDELLDSTLNCPMQAAENDNEWILRSPHLQQVRCCVLPV